MQYRLQLTLKHKKCKINTIHYNLITMGEICISFSKMPILFSYICKNNKYPKIQTKLYCTLLLAPIPGGSVVRSLSRLFSSFLFFLLSGFPGFPAFQAFQLALLAYGPAWPATLPASIKEKKTKTVTLTMPGMPVATIILNTSIFFR